MRRDAHGPEFPVSEAIYAQLLRAYPRLHRAAYGAAMAQLFCDQCRDAWNEGSAWGLMKLWGRTLPDLACTSILERLAALKERKTMTEKLANLFAFRVTPASTFFRVFAVVFLLVFLASVAVTFILPESYASTARIRVESDAGTANGQSSAYDPYFIQTTFEIMHSELVLSNVIAALNLNTKWGQKYANGQTLKPSETMAILRQRLLLAPVKNTTLIAITVFSEDKHEAAAIANAVADSYCHYRQASRAELAARNLQVLQDNYQAQAVQIEKAQANVDALQVKAENTPYWVAKQDLEHLLESQKMLYAKIEEQKLATQVPPRALVQITDPAVPGQAPVKPNKPLNLVLGAVAGIFLATLAGAAFAFLSFTIGGRMRKTPAAT